MNRRPTASGRPAKPRSPKTTKAKRRIKPIEASGRWASAAREESEVARLTRELDDALERQAATSEVLSMVSSSSGELDPVFHAILEKATRICEANFGLLFRLNNGVVQTVVMLGLHQALAEVMKPGLKPGPNSATARAIRTGRPIHIPDIRQEKGYLEGDPMLVAGADKAGIRTLLAVPMVHNQVPIGSIGIYRTEVRPFTDKQIELVESFAAQAVIAIENARLLNELRQRTTDLSGALEQQTATSRVLQVISSSPGDLEPVFTTILENATRICDARFGVLHLKEDEDAFRTVAIHNAPPDYVAAKQRDPLIRHFPPTSALGRVRETRLPVQIADVREEPAYRDEHIDNTSRLAFAHLTGVRSLLAVPMLNDEILVGVIVIYRQEVRPFTDKQLELLQNFAAQAVIAIENARLLNELRQRTNDLTEALEHQTATSDILQVVASSTGVLEPVFQTILQKAVTLCAAKFATLYLSEEDAFRAAALHNAPAALAEMLNRSLVRPGPHVPLGRVAATKKLAHIADMMSERCYLEGDPLAVMGVELGGYRTVLVVPMLKDEVLIGAIAIYRQEVDPFDDDQAALLANFAAQAVIAVENARLLNELRQRTADLTEALEQQTATSEVLQVISSSPGDLQPVFATMLEKAVRLCDATFGNIYRWDGEQSNILASHNTPPALVEARKRLGIRFVPKDLVGQAIANKKAVHIADLAEHQDYIERSSPGAVEAVEHGGVRTHVVVPMLKDDELIGTFHLSRQEVRPFTDKQIELVTNFAAQAVIAIENTRLLKELRERTEEVEKLNQHLAQRVTDQVGEIERMGRLRRFLPPQVADLIVASGTEKQLESHRREITALFCDLRGFTGFSESADPEDVMTVLREYHKALGASIIKYSGTLERYAGDGVMVVFNDPVPVENPALQAVLMALEMRDAIGALTETWRRWGHDIGFGIGIAHGFATLGTIGFEGRFDYAAIGTVSNVASRLCDEAKPGQILISPRVLTKVENAVTVEPVGEFDLKGIRRPLAAYNVVDLVSAKTLDAQS